MNDPITIQAESDAKLDHYRETLNKQARELAALRVENQHLRSALDEFRRATTIPAPPNSDSLPSPRDAMPTIEWDSSATNSLLPEAS